MLAVYEALDRIEARLLMDMLAGHGIQTFLQGDFLTGAAGDLPATQFPSIWVLDDRDSAVAKSRIKQYFDDVSDGSRWVCQACGEQLDASFQQCWQCGAFKPQ